MVKRHLAWFAALSLSACALPPGSSVLFKCDEGDVCRAGSTCWTDGYCHPDTDGAEPRDAGRVDAGHDAGAGDDAGFDAGFDAGDDAGHDAGFDAGVDAGFDAGPCVPVAACPGQVECGRFDAGCGVTLDCGGCTTPEECGTVTPHVCGLPHLCAHGFCWENPLPQGNTLFGASALGPRAVWAVGEVGTVLFWNGERSALLDVGTTVDLRAVFATSASDVYVGGEQGVIVHFDGVRWQRESTPGVYRINALWAAPGGIAFAATTGGYVLKRETNATWSEMGFASSSSADLLSIVGLDTGEVFTTSLARLWRLPSRSSGTWQGDTTWPAGRELVALGARQGQLYAAAKASAQAYGTLSERQPDAGWRQLTPNIQPSITALAVTASTQWVSTPTGVVMRFEADGGASPTTLARDGGVLALTAADEQVFVVGAQGLMAFVDDAGARSLSSGATTDINAACGYSEGRVYAPGNSSLVYERRTSIDGARWDAVARSTSNTWHWLSCFADGPDRVWVTGDDRQFLRQSGGVFVVDDLGNRQDWHVWGSAGGPIYFVGSATWISSSATGASPSFVYSSLPQPRGVWGLSNDDVLIVAAGGGLHARTSAGWVSYPTPPQLGRSLTGVHGQRLPDGGSLYSVVGVNTAWRRVGGNFVADTIDPGNALRGTWVSPTGDIWAVGDDGGTTSQGRAVLWRYDDDAGWVAQQPPTRAALNAVTGFGDVGPFIVGQGGVILRHVAADGG